MSPSMRHAALVTLGLGVLTAGAAQSRDTSLLVTPRALARELSDPSIVLLQVGPRDDYEAGHIEGARLVDLRDIALFDSAPPRVLELPDEADLRGRLERLGISDGSRIVVMSGSDRTTGDVWMSPATRVVWTLQAAGLGNRTRLLDGGLPAWKRAGLPVTNAVPPVPRAGRLTVAADRSVVVDHRWIQAHVRAPGVRIIDGRAPMFFEGPGMPEHNAAAGHVAGAANIPFNSLTTDSSIFLPLAELRKKFEASGVQPGDTVAAYCHVGQQATVVLFAARLLGHPVRLYDGSMNDWQQRKLPLENATAPKKPDRSARGGAR
jgi:thiosulfate/3-mercaptopyruvate sulfurtransferase